MTDRAQYTPNLGPRVERLEKNVEGVTARVRVLEQEVGETRALRSERDRRIFDKLDEIQTRLDKMDSHRVWATRTVLGAVILAAVAFLLRGGLHLGG